jgi:hypothetical protein
LRPRDPNGRVNLAIALQRRGRFDEAAAELRGALPALGPNDPFRGEVWRQLRLCRRRAELDRRFPELLSAYARLSPEEQTELGQLAHLYKQEHLAAVRLFEAAFAARPASAAGSNRYYTACSAALAGTAPYGSPDGSIPEQERRRMRQRGLEWLEAEWALLALVAYGDAPQKVRKLIVPRVWNWLRDPDLQRVRDPNALASLPAKERAAWETFWAKAVKLRRAATGPGR